MKNLISLRLLFSLLFVFYFGMIKTTVWGQVRIDSTEHEKIVNYLQEQGIVDQIDKVTLWTTAYALDTTHVARNMIAEKKKKDIAFPYSESWLVMIDDYPEANFGHPVRWIFINGDFTEHSDIMNEEFPPVIVSEYGKGSLVDFRCWDLTPYKCVLMEEYLPVEFIKVAPRNCRYAILVSGGANSTANKPRYAQNLRSMYTLLRNAGYPKNHIYVYYADGTLQLDCDNEDGDNNDATGNDVTAGAVESTIRARFQNLCTPSRSRCKTLFSYFSNHGSNDVGVCLWDFNGNGTLESNELYSPAELASDVANTNFCRHFMLHDQCYSGDFLPLATDGNHDDLVVYAAATGSESSWGREYMAQWEQNDITTSTVNDMHQDVVANGNLTSTPGMAEGTVNIGNHLAGSCCCWWWWWKYWYIVLIVVVVVIIIVIIVRRRYKKR